MGSGITKPNVDDSATSAATTAAGVQEVMDRIRDIGGIQCILSDDVSIGPRLGGGTFGQVYDGRIISTNVRLAFKMSIGLPPQSSRRGVFSADDWVKDYHKIFRKQELKVHELIRRFPFGTCHHTVVPEIETLVYLKAHPNIVHIHSVVVTPNIGLGSYGPGTPVVEVWIAMERCSGSLMQLIVDQPKLKIPRVAMCSVFAQLLEGLAYVHTMGVVHRDIKSQNVLLSPTGVVKIADFGSARKIPTPEEKPQTYITTTPFRAPELEALVSETYDEKIDVWSAGVLLLELLTRKRVFGDGPEPYQLLKGMFAMRGAPTSRFAASELISGKRGHLVATALAFATTEPMTPRMCDEAVKCHGGDTLLWLPLVDVAISMLEYSSKERPSAAAVLAQLKASGVAVGKASDVVDALVA